ncbi:MAG: PhoPQ-activated pathogenicity-related family protein [Sedimentisphaerales bacterium]|nr:PhoPQ-activated pathogenicity-related family protein [Sedimentisphaerales bacterium]
MNKHSRFAVAILLIGGFTQVAAGTALDDYVAAPDSSYKYEVVKTIEGAGITTYVIDMTSQTWRSKEEVDRPVWRHRLTIFKPDKANADTALLHINGGSNRSDFSDGLDMALSIVAVQAGAVLADLKTVPNQPLNFVDGGRPRSEDAIIAYSFDKFLETGDATWPVLLPMAKSAVRAMDTVQSHLKGLDSGALNIKKFVVAGASKRGWTTWLTAAVDKRVVAICPAVIDVLNMGESMRHHHAAYGFWAPAIHDYEEMKIFDRLDTPRGKELRGFIDPYSYRERYTMPKLLLNSSGDQFFLPDSAQFYFADLPGEKYVRYFPNTGHGLDFSAFGSVIAFCRSVLEGAKMPVFGWAVRENGSMVVECETQPKEARLWQATNAEKRDFRIDVLGPQWTSSPLEPAGRAGRYVAEVSAPEKGWTGYFVELVFDAGAIGEHRLTTEIRVLPKDLPFAK